MSTKLFRAKDFFGVLGEGHRVHPTRAAERANARLAPLVAALERLAEYVGDFEVEERMEVVLAEYRKLKEGK
jgi:hypothetical protein